MSSSPPLRIAPRATDSHKGTFGRVLLVGASRGMSGSIAMSALAALKSGAGLVTAAVPDRCLETVASFHPSIMTLAMPDTDQGVFAMQAAADLGARIPAASAIGCGPGMTTANGSIRLVERLLQTRTVARVFDADGLNCLALLMQSGWQPASKIFTPQGKNGQLENGQLENWGPIVLTPHPGELERLTGVAPSDRTGQLKAAEALSEAMDAVIVVKGGPTHVIQAGNTWINPTGNPGMATAGSGDVLTGVIASLMGQGLSPWDASRLGVWVHGLAGDLAADQNGQMGMTSREILDALPKAMTHIVE